MHRVFSDAKIKPFDQIEWEMRTAEITDDAGKVIFKQENVEVPKSWSILATKVVVSKYFYGELNTAERETSVRQLIHRICRTIADWGVRDGYFTKADGEIYYDELTWLCLNQYGAFNSPGVVQRRALRAIRHRQKFREGELCGIEDPLRRRCLACGNTTFVFRRHFLIPHADPLRAAAIIRGARDTANADGLAARRSVFEEITAFPRSLRSSSTARLRCEQPPYAIAS